MGERKTYLQMLAIHVQQQQNDLRKLLDACQPHDKHLQQEFKTLIHENQLYLESLRLADITHGTEIHALEQKLP